MNKHEYRSIIKDFKRLHRDNLEEKKLMFNYFIKVYIRSYKLFGPDHKITLDAYNLWHEFKKIIKEEEKIYNFIISNDKVMSVDIDEFYNLVDILNELNEKTVLYYYQVINDIEDACETKEEYRANHLSRNFKFITETDEYLYYAIGLLLDFDNVKDFLNYPDDFWDYVKDKTVFIDDRDKSDNKMLYEVVLHFDEDDNFNDMRIIVPKIINLFTALVNVHEFKHAYDVYSVLGKKVSDEDASLYEKNAIDKEKEFVKSYLPDKYFSSGK